MRKYGSIRVLFLATTVSGVWSIETLSAQEQPKTNYRSLACLKIDPAKVAEYTAFVQNEWTKVAQARVNAGEFITFAVSRNTLPGGAQAGCDFIAGTVSTGPSETPPMTL